MVLTNACSLMIMPILPKANFASSYSLERKKKKKRGEQTLRRSRDTFVYRSINVTQDSTYS